MPPSIHQINFSVQNIGKTKQDTKRRIKWVYAIGDNDRHEVIFTWSLVSGKQLVTINGETMISQQWQRTVFNEQILTTSNGHPVILRLVCSRTVPSGAHSNFRQYELLINDRPYFTYPRLDGRGFAVEAETPELPTSILGLLYPGKYYVGNGAAKSKDESPRSVNDVISDDDEEDVPAIPKVGSVSSSGDIDRNSANIDAPYDELE